MAITRKAYEARLQKWLTALRSGEYKQCTGQLYSNYGNTDSYCCLGVACEVFNHNSPVKVKRKGFAYGRMRINSYIPTKVAKWLGMTIDGQYRCVKMNDNDRKLFKQIATIVENNKSKYFIWAQEKVKKNEK